MKVSRKLLRRLVAKADVPPPVVTFRQVTVCFSDRTVDIDGRRIVASTDCLTFPILSGDAVFMPKGDMERVA